MRGCWRAVGVAGVVAARASARRPRPAVSLGLGQVVLDGHAVGAVEQQPKQRPFAADPVTRRIGSANNSSTGTGRQQEGGHHDPRGAVPLISEIENHGQCRQAEAAEQQPDRGHGVHAAPSVAW